MNPVDLFKELAKEIPFDYSEKWLEYAKISADGVRSIEPKQKKVRK